MLYMAYTGSKVLHARAAEFAYKYEIPLEIKSSYEYKEGTMIDHKMENSTVKTLSHKDEIIVVYVKTEEQKIPHLTTEIFDIELYKDSLEIYLEQKYKIKLLGELETHGWKPILTDEVYCIINLLGYRICRDLQFFATLHDSLAKVCQKPFSIKNQGIGVQITVEQVDAKDVLEHLNQEYILENK
jgi:aspartate kinase